MRRLVDKQGQFPNHRGMYLVAALFKLIEALVDIVLAPMGYTADIGHMWMMENILRAGVKVSKERRLHK